MRAFWTDRYQKQTCRRYATALYAFGNALIGILVCDGFAGSVSTAAISTKTSVTDKHSRYSSAIATTERARYTICIASIHSAHCKTRSIAYLILPMKIAACYVKQFGPRRGNRG